MLMLAKKNHPPPPQKKNGNCASTFCLKFGRETSITMQKTTKWQYNSLSDNYKSSNIHNGTFYSYGWNRGWS